ncbi:MAG: 50S ribosomal protein L19e [Candidatus Micrarchaeota archaeon]
MAFNTVRRLAADIMSVGENRVRFATDKLADIKNAMTRTDVRDLISKKAIIALPKQGRLKVGRTKKRGPGSIRGSKSGSAQKVEWMARVRSQRKLLRELIASSVLKLEDKRYIYLKIKGGSFKSKRALITYLKDNALVAKDYELKKVVPKKYQKGETK